MKRWLDHGAGSFPERFKTSVSICLLISTKGDTGALSQHFMSWELFIRVPHHELIKPHEIAIHFSNSQIPCYISWNGACYITRRALGIIEQFNIRLYDELPKVYRILSASLPSRKYSLAQRNLVAPPRVRVQMEFLTMLLMGWWVCWSLCFLSQIIAHKV